MTTQTSESPTERPDHEHRQRARMHGRVVFVTGGTRGGDPDPNLNGRDNGFNDLGGR